MNLIWADFYKKLQIFISGPKAIFISGYAIFVFVHWRHFVAAIALVDTITVLLITFSFVIIFGTSFAFSKMASSIFFKGLDRHFFNMTWIIVQFALLALYIGYEKYESRISVYHLTMKIAPVSLQSNASVSVKQCRVAIRQENWDKAYHQCLKGSAERNSEAQTNLAFMYFEGLGPLRHKRTGRNGFIESLTGRTGKISKNEAYLKAEKLLKSASDRGFSAAQYNLGIYYIGFNAPDADFGNKDYGRAKKYFLLAANQGDAEAIYNLAVMFDNGDGVKKDRDISNQLYKMSSDKGFNLAKNVIWLNEL